MGAGEIGACDIDRLEIGVGEDRSEARAAVRQPADQYVAQLGFAPGGDCSAVVTPDVVVDLVGMWASDPGFAGGAVSCDGVLAEVEPVVECALAPVEGAFQGGHGWSGRGSARRDGLAVGPLPRVTRGPPRVEHPPNSPRGDAGGPTSRGHGPVVAAETGR